MVLYDKHILTDFRKFVIGLIKTIKSSLIMNSLLHRTYCTEELSLNEVLSTANENEIYFKYGDLCKYK